MATVFRPQRTFYGLVREADGSIVATDFMSVGFMSLPLRPLASYRVPNVAALPTGIRFLDEGPPAALGAYALPQLHAGSTVRGLFNVWGLLVGIWLTSYGLLARHAEPRWGLVAVGLVLLAAVFVSWWKAAGLQPRVTSLRIQALVVALICTFIGIRMAREAIADGEYERNELHVAHFPFGVPTAKTPTSAHADVWRARPDHPQSAHVTLHAGDPVEVEVPGGYTTGVATGRSTLGKYVHRRHMTVHTVTIDGRTYDIADEKLLLVK